MADRKSNLIDVIRRCASIGVAVVALVIAMAVVAYPSEGPVSNDSPFTTKGVEKSVVLYSRLPEPSHGSLLHINEEIKDIYPIGRPQFLTFSDSIWLLTPDGIAAVQLALPRPGEQNEIVSLYGAWKAEDGMTEFHLKGEGNYGLKVALHGLLVPVGQGYAVDALLTVAVRGARHVERVALRLAHAPKVLGAVELAGVEAYRRTAHEMRAFRETNLLSEPTEWIGGVPVPTGYDAEISVRLDGEELPPQAGVLLLRKGETPGATDVEVTLGSDGPVSAGWSAWVTVPRPGISSGEAVSATASHGRVHLDIPSASVFQQMTWWARDPKNRNDVVPVVPLEGTIDLQVSGDTFSGTINAKGRHLEGRHLPSTFSAVLSGTRQGSDYIKKISRFTGGHLFEGTWRDSRLGELKLHQQKTSVTGGFSGGPSIEGNADGATLHFWWKDAAGEKGKGFLSTACSGILAGMLWQGESSAPEPVIAIQATPERRPGDEAATFVPPPVNDAEAMELKFLGYDLNFSGKTEEATQALDAVVAYYADTAEKSQKDTGKYGWYTVSQMLPLLTLMDAASEAGNYPVLIKALRRAVKVQTELRRDTIRLRNIRQQAVLHIKELEENATRMENISDAYARGIDALSAAGVGIGFAEKEGSGIPVTSARPDMPAARAGVLEGDILVAIDGIPVTGMTAEEASAKLRGDVGTTVMLTIVRSGHRKNIAVVRAALSALTEERKRDLAKGMSAIRKSTGETAGYLRADATAIKGTLHAMERQPVQKSDAEAALLDLEVRIERLRARLNEYCGRTATSVKTLLVDLPKGHDIFVRAVALQDALANTGYLNGDAQDAVQKLDQEEEDYQQGTEASEVEKEILQLSIILMSQAYSMKMSANNRLRLVKQQESASIEEQMAELGKEFNLKLNPEVGPDAIASQLAALSARLDMWRAKMATDAARIESLQYGQGFYADYVATLADLNEPELALVAAESARARAFQDLLAGRGEEGGAAVVASSTGTPLPKPLAAPPVTLQDLIAIVKERKSTVVEYMQTENELFIWVVSPDAKINMIRKPVKREALKTSVENFVELVEPDTRSEKDQVEREKRLMAVLRDLHAQLLEPIPPSLLPDDPEAPLTIIPYEEIFRVPFAALRDAAGEYFITKHALAFSPALSVLRYTRENKTRAPAGEGAKLLAVVNPKPLPSNKLKPLDETEEGLQLLLKLYPASTTDDILVGNDATKSNLKKRLAAEEHSVIYFGTHGNINDREILASYIAMAKLAGSDNAEDGMLKVRDVFSLNLRSDLSILSACGTGRGVLSADGVNGLSRAFFWGGAASLLSSLWSVPESESLQQIYDFNLYWRNGCDKANALRKAQIRAMTFYGTQPELWGGFQLYGEWQ